MRHLLKTLAFALLWTAVGITNASATAIQMDQGDLYSPLYYGVGTMGTGRGVGFSVSTAFHMSTLGIDIGVPNATVDLFEFQIYSSADGHNAGALLAVTQFQLAQGEGWQDFAFAYDFAAGFSYVINFTGATGGLPAEFGTMYSWEPSAHVDYGVLNVVEGFEGAFPNPGNPLVAHFRIDGATAPVPEPGTMLLLGSGLLGLAARRRRSA